MHAPVTKQVTQAEVEFHDFWINTCNILTALHFPCSLYWCEMLWSCAINMINITHEIMKEQDKGIFLYLYHVYNTSSFSYYTFHTHMPACSIVQHRIILSKISFAHHKNCDITDVTSAHGLIM